jgi:signal transduction histidine kinase
LLPDQLPIVRAVMAQDMARNPTGPNEFTLKRKDGRLVEVEISTFPVAIQEQSLILGVARDITERRQAEQRRLELALERERVQILADFIAQASHEFRTPLSTINTSTYLLQKSTDSVEQLRYIQQIEDRVHDITTLLNALLTMSRLDGLRELTTEPVDLGGLVKIAYTARQKAWQTRAIQGTLRLPAEPLLIAGDAGYLRQAIGAILDNAIRFTPDGGAIAVHLEQVGETAVLAITDTGIGIGAADLPHIFERFYRGDKAGTTRGFGLGLPIAKGIVELHRGSISVESEEGKGSTFKILLPVG